MLTKAVTMTAITAIMPLPMTTESEEDVFQNPSSETTEPPRGCKTDASLLISEVATKLQPMQLPTADLPKTRGKRPDHGIWPVGSPGFALV